MNKQNAHANKKFRYQRWLKNKYGKYSQVHNKYIHSHTTETLMLSELNMEFLRYVFPITI